VIVTVVYSLDAAQFCNKLFVVLDQFLLLAKQLHDAVRWREI